MPVDEPDIYNYTGQTSSNYRVGVMGRCITTVKMKIQSGNLEDSFVYFKALKRVELTGETKITSVKGMFYECGNLETVILNNFDTSELTSVQGMFNQSGIKELPLFDTSSVTNFNYFAQQCSKLEAIPLYNTHNVTSFNNSFNSCRQLKNIPILDTSSVTDFSGMFNSVLGFSSTITDESLNNVLQMCINATSYTGTKKLTTLDYSVTSVRARIQGLSNYQAFIDAGWVIS